MTATSTIEPTDIALAAILETVDTLLGRYAALAAEAARLRARIDDLHAERKVREARAAIGIEGRNSEERAARLTLALAADGDYRRLAEEERQARLKLAEVEASAWVTKTKVRTCLALLRLAGDAADADGDGEGEPDAAGV